MSFKPIRSAYSLTFQNYPGLHVKMRSSTLGEITAISSGAEESAAAQLSQLKFFAKKLISWNVVHPELEPDDSDTPPSVCMACGLREDDVLPPTLAGIMCLEPSFALSIIKGYMGQVSSPDPKASSAPNTGVTPETLRRLAERQNPLK